MEHTPTPWTTYSSGTCVYSGKTRIAECDMSTGNDKRNAAHIVRCVNSHDALVLELEKCIYRMREALNGETYALQAEINSALKTLKQAKGE